MRPRSARGSAGASIGEHVLSTTGGLTATFRCTSSASDKVRSGSIFCCRLLVGLEDRVRATRAALWEVRRVARRRAPFLSECGLRFSCGFLGLCAEVELSWLRARSGRGPRTEKQEDAPVFSGHARPHKLVLLGRAQEAERTPLLRPTTSEQRKR